MCVTDVFCERTNIASAGLYFRVSRVKGTVYFWNDNVKAIVSFDGVWFVRGLRAAEVWKDRLLPPFFRLRNLLHVGKIQVVRWVFPFK